MKRRLLPLALMLPLAACHHGEPPVDGKVHVAVSGVVGGAGVADHAARLGRFHFRGRQISVSNSAGGVLLGLFRLTSNSGASAGSSPLAVSQANKAS